MSYWLCGLLAIIFAPLAFLGYYNSVKKNHIQEITWFVDFLEKKEKLNEEEKVFIKEAKDYLSEVLNNFEKKN
jgi:hypothetical protein